MPPRAHDGVPPAAIARMRRRRDFLAANSGVRVVTPAFILLVRANCAGTPRTGFTVSKKVGNSVARNRARRRLREVARLVLPGTAVAGADHVFIARPAERERPFAALLLDAEGAIRRAARKLDATP